MERVAIKRALRDLDALAMDGIFLSHRGNIMAFTMGSFLNGDTFDVQFEKAFTENEFLNTNHAYEEIISYRDEAQKAEGKCQLDLHLANQWILKSAGILPEHISVTDVCTAHNPDYLFSHRKTDGKRGNLGAFLCLR